MADLRLFRISALIGALLLAGIALPSSAHEEHKKRKPVAAEVVSAPNQPPGQPSTSASPAASSPQGTEEIEAAAEDRSRMSMIDRLLDWLGRLHPLIVHFPVAFFPAALFCAILARRKPTFAAPAHFLIISGSVVAPVAAILGWLDAIGADPDPLLTVHRWLGTLIAIAATALGIWAWRLPDDRLGRSKIVALSLITAAVLVQGWYGGALVHGADHLNW